ncbi:hypothetical protein MNBD_GAMMA17-175 [hydrothermal vent metagenome]|uniref:Uncharacterized protein n=1 Tax=hydrothermal vent metagenome TaxID=652676 RepID=A0A3B0ZLQ2_9ZZZZ
MAFSSTNHLLHNLLRHGTYWGLFFAIALAPFHLKAENGKAITGWEIIGNTGTDSNTNFLGTTDSEDLVIRTNNTERVRVNRRGRVGIGTDDPRQLLHVEVVNHLTNSVSNAARLSHATSGIPEEGLGTGLEFHIRGAGGSDATLGVIESVLTDATAGEEGGALQFKTTDGSEDGLVTRMSITEDGNVGININNPSSRLVIKNDSFGQRPLMSIIAGDETPFHISSTGSVTIDPVGAGVALRVKASSSSGSSDTTPVPFYVTAKDGVNAIYVAKDGDVGIGTAGEGITDKLRIRGPENNGLRATVRIISGRNQQTMLLDGNEIDGLNAGLFLNHNSSEKVILATGGGNVGIGTTNPNHTLVVQSDDPVVQIRDNTIDNSANAARLELLERAGGAFDAGAFFRWNGLNNRLNIGTIEDGVDSSAMVITRSNANVGIGTVTPQSRLHVQGNSGTDILITDGEFSRMRMVATDPANDVTLSIQARGSDAPNRAEIGTVSNHDMALFANGAIRLVIGRDGNVCIGNC